MTLKTEAIVLSIHKFKENATVVHLFTQENGRMDLLLYGAQSKKKGKSFSFLHPLSIGNIDADIKNSKELNTIKEIKQAAPTLEILFNPIKSTIAFFLAEVLSHALRTNEKDTILFQFIRNSIAGLDAQEKGLGNFHILFLLRLSKFLGFQPTIEEDASYHFFDLQEGELTIHKPIHNHYLRSNEIHQLKQLLRMNQRNMHIFKFSRTERMDLVERILDYYRLHLHGFGDIKSIYVLKEIFD